MRPKTKALIREYAESIAIAIVLALVVRTFVVQAFKIPSGSMRPTLLEGDRILVNKFIYRFREPKPGDIVVFKSPEDPKRDFIKRLVATEGQRVKIHEGQIFVDGKLLSEDGFGRRYYYNQGLYGNEGEEFTVPDEGFYVLGDNSASSRDSRYWGFVPRRNMVGKAFFLYWPPHRIRVSR